MRTRKIARPVIALLLGGCVLGYVGSYLALRRLEAIEIHHYPGQYHHEQTNQSVSYVNIEIPAAPGALKVAYWPLWKLESLAKFGWICHWLRKRTPPQSR